jgi:hypothetical protein
MLNLPRIVIAPGLLVAAIPPPLLLCQAHVPEPPVNLGDGVAGPDVLFVVLSGFGFRVLSEAADEDDFVEHDI